MESLVSIPRGTHDCSVKMCVTSYSNDASDFTVATGIDYINMTRRCYEHSSDEHCVR
jgi:hypothetical protein